MPAPDSPALAPPPGVVPDFYSPYSLCGYHHVVAAQGAILTTVMVIARIYTKRFVLKKVSLEDCEAAYYHDPVFLTRPRFMCFGMGMIIASSRNDSSGASDLCTIHIACIHCVCWHPRLHSGSWWRHPSMECALCRLPV